PMGTPNMMAKPNPTRVSWPVTSVYCQISGNFITNWTRIAEGGGRMYIGTWNSRMTASQAIRMAAPKRTGVRSPVVWGRAQPMERRGRPIRAIALEDAVAKEDLLDVTDELLELRALAHRQGPRARQVDLDPADDLPRPRRDDHHLVRQLHGLLDAVGDEDH